MNGNRAAKSILALLLAILLIPSMPAGAMEEPPVPGQEVDSVSDSAEGEPEPYAGNGNAPVATPTALGYSGARASDGAALLELLESNPGGVITLDGDITLSGGPGIIYLYSPLTVDAGPHTITVDTYLDILGPITFTGSGTVIRVTGNGHLGLGGQGATIANGDGAIALYLEPGGEYNQNTPVRANGTGATGIYAEGDRDFDSVEVTATGAGSIGIHTTGSATLLLSFVQGGGGSVVSDTGEITLVGGGARPMPAGVTAISLHGTHEQEKDYITAVGNRPIDFELYEEGFGLRFEPENGTQRGISYPAILDESRVDYHTPGTYPLTVELVLPFATDLMTWDPLEFTVTVLQSDRPQITKASLIGEDSLLLHLLEEIPAAWWVRVWCSEDGGDTWRDLDEDGAVTVMGAALQIEGLPDDATYQFYLEVWGGPLQGTSNTLEFYADPDDRQGGGEREGDSDGEDNALPPVTQPPPGESGTGAGQTTSGGSAGSGIRGGGRSAGQGADTDPVNIREQAAEIPTHKPGEVETESVPQTLEPEHEAVEAAAPVQAEPIETGLHSYPDGVTVWSADRLASLALRYPEQVTFYSGGLSARLPTDALLEAVGGKDFALLLEQPAEDAFRIHFYTDGAELEELGGQPFQVVLPMPGEGAELRCVRESSEQAEVMREGSRTVITLTRTGGYHLETMNQEAVILPLAAEGPAQWSEPEMTAATTRSVLWIILSATAFVAAAAGFLLLRKRRLGRG